MAKQREGVKPDSISNIWFDEASYCEEPWHVVALDDGDGEIYAKDAKACYGHAIPLPEAHRIAACVNFCREFNNEFIKNHKLHYIGGRLTASPKKEGE